jgi:acyl carrier protein
MNEQELRAVLMRALAEVAPDIDPDSIDPAAELAELEIDSMDFLNLVVAVHEQTGIDIPERDYSKLSTIDAAVAYLAEAQQRGAGGDG